MATEYILLEILDMTVFTNYEFFFRFFPIFLILYYVLPKKWQNHLLFVGSIVFYSFGQLKFMPLLLGLTVFNYGLAYVQQKKMDKIKVTSLSRIHLFATRGL